MSQPAPGNGPLPPPPSSTEFTDVLGVGPASGQEPSGAESLLGAFGDEGVPAPPGGASDGDLLGQLASDAPVMELMGGSATGTVEDMMRGIPPPAPTMSGSGGDDFSMFEGPPKVVALAANSDGDDLLFMSAPPTITPNNSINLGPGVDLMGGMGNEASGRTATPTRVPQSAEEAKEMAAARKQQTQADIHAAVRACGGPPAPPRVATSRRGRSLPMLVPAPSPGR